MIGYFVTGTDTNAGKTFVTCALAARARALGHRVWAWKPVETGCDGVGPDQEALVASAGGWQRGEAAGLLRFALPAAPRVAAAAEGRRIDAAAVLAAYRRIVAAEQPEVVLVEGAGGWRVPFDDELDMGGVARALGLPVVVVARAGLGTINHTLLTVEAVERDGARCAGVVMSRTPEVARAVAEGNREEVLRRWAGRIWILDTDGAALDPLLDA